LNWGWMRYLGRISYSVYLYQQIVLHPAERFASGLPYAVQTVIAAGAVIAFASVSYWFIEQPFLRLKQRFQNGSALAGRMRAPQAEPLALPLVQKQPGVSTSSNE
jgi:peptidoglycan/LPS O-acetylase OafA/YrhL